MRNSLFLSGLMYFVACTNAAEVYTIGGKITGLKGTIVLDLNGSQTTTLYADSEFMFMGGKAAGTQYNVTVKTQPSGLVCRVTNGSGTLYFNVRDVTVSCASSILVASWNVQNYGTSKAAKTTVMDLLSKVIMRYDVFFMQEVSTIGGGAGSCGDNSIVEICTLLNRINSDDRAGAGSFGQITTPNSGSGGTAEKYSVFYRKSAVSISETGLASSPAEGTYTRPPMYARVKTTTVDFYVLSIHTNPTNATQEIQDLPYAANARYTTDPDIMIVGDFNSDGAYFNETTGWATFNARFVPVSPAWTNAIADTVDTTIAQGNQYTYDRMVLSPGLAAKMQASSAAPHYFDGLGTGATCTSGDYTQLMNAIISAGLASTCNGAALQVSDHYPVQVQINL